MRFHVRFLQIVVCPFVASSSAFRAYIVAKFVSSLTWIVIVTQWDAFEVMNAKNCIQVDMPNARLQVQTFEIFY